MGLDQYTHWFVELSIEFLGGGEGLWWPIKERLLILTEDAIGILIAIKFNNSISHASSTNSQLSFLYYFDF